MESKSSRYFYAYRYFMVDSGQLELSDIISNDINDKQKPIDRMINECTKIRKIRRSVDGKDNILVSCEGSFSDIHIFKFSKDMPITKFDISDTRSDIIETKESNFPFIYVIIDRSNQIILLEKKTTIYSKATQARKAFHDFVIEYTHNPGHTFSIDEITDVASFWDTVNEAENIYEMTLRLRSPNLFGATFKTNELLKRIKEEINNDEFDVSFKSTSGSLKINKEIQDPIEYAANGGGSWKITHGKRGKKKRTVSSESKVKAVEIESFSEHLNNHSMFSIDEIAKKVKEINDALAKKGWKSKESNEKKN